MPPLSKDLRKTLSDVTLNARAAAEAACRAALENLAVHEKEYRSHMTVEQRQLRNRLRARGRALGDRLDATRGTQEIKRLAEDAAYEHWHRLLFTRFLTENHLLHTDEDQVPVTLEDCEELAPEMGAKDGFDLACRFASRTLPGVFRVDDPIFELNLAQKDQVELSRLLDSLPSDIFTASDSLGWTYQFWQAKRKEEVNKSGNKIGADELSPVTQLFTEDYMVDFLFDNTLGAWHAGKVLAANPKLAETAESEDELRQAVALPGCPWKYLRFVQGSTGVPPVSDDKHGQDARAPFFDPYRELDIHERNLPHWQQETAWIFVTWRLADSLPAEKLGQWKSEKEAWLRNHPEPWDDRATREFHENFSQRMDDWLDAGKGSCILARPHLRQIVVDALHHFDGERYELGDYVVMPNHIHLLVQPTKEHSLAGLLHSWKSFTSKEINRATNGSGAVWQEEYWDRLIRNERHLNACRRYIAGNPAKAKLATNQYFLRSTDVPPVNAPDHGQDARAPLSWTPAAGSFDGWPKKAKELKCLDPCMGSGHFVVAMFERLVALRMAEEKLDEQAAVAAVIRDNLFGLEIDPRCTQIAAFNLVLGSLINPRAGEGDLLVAAFHELQPLLEKALAQETKDDTAHEMAVTAHGLAKAAEILADQFTLVATNVPFKETKQLIEPLQAFININFSAGHVNLATAFVLRIRQFLSVSGVAALVTPHEWLFLKSYTATRETLLGQTSWRLLADLGEKGFQSPQAAGAFTALIAFTNTKPAESNLYAGWDVTKIKMPADKALGLLNEEPHSVLQSDQLKNPDARIGLAAASGLPLLSKYAGAYVGLQNGDTPCFVGCFWEIPSVNSVWSCFQLPCDSAKHFGGRDGILRWEGGNGALASSDFARIQGCEAWNKKGVAIRQTRKLPATGYSGDIFDQSSAAIIPHDPEHLPAIWAYCFSQQFHDDVRKIDKKKNVTNATLVKVPFDLAHWQKVAAEKYPHGLPKPFSSDPTQWLFNGHPNPLHPDPNRPTDAPSDLHNSSFIIHTLHVALARLLGYQWPRQTGSSFPDCPALGPDGLEKLADDDGIVCLPAINREQPAAARLRTILAASRLGTFDERQLLAACGSKSKTLEDWLRDEFFEQHCALFHQRPFLWHIWDGRKDGFAAVVNYHRLDNAALQKLTYTTLGNWIQNQDADAKADKPGAAERLAAAQSLQAELIAILEGEAPYDIFVRWKPLSQQPIGWHPDINDGVRLNIRPFLTANDVAKRGAGLLRAKPNIKWDKDRGKEPVRPKSDYPWFWCETEPTTDPEGEKEFHGHRWNNVHLTLAFKKDAKP